MAITTAGHNSVMVQKIAQTSNIQGNGEVSMRNGFGLNQLGRTSNYVYFRLHVIHCVCLLFFAFQTRSHRCRLPSAGTYAGLDGPLAFEHIAQHLFRSNGLASVHTYDGLGLDQLARRSDHGRLRYAVLHCRCLSLPSKYSDQSNGNARQKRLRQLANG